MRSRKWTCCLAVLALVAFGAAAQAAPRMLPAQGVPGRLPLPSEDLPGGPRPVPSELIEAALSLPETRAAMAQMEANGYTRAPGADAAQAQDGRAIVALAFTDPANPGHAPIVIVASETSGETSRTWVAGGVFREDPATMQVSLADDVPEANQFVVRAPGPGGSGTRSPATYSRERPSLRMWAACSLAGCGVVFGACSKISNMFLLPLNARVGCVIAGCGIAGFLCLW